jgi:hypothetical protein
MATEKETATNVATENIETVLTGVNECKKIICISDNNPYGKGKRNELGKTYSLYRYGKIAFTVATDNPFVADHKAGNLYQVSLLNGTAPKKTIDEDGNEIITQVPSLEFDYHITQDQETAGDEFELKKATIQFKKDAFKSITSKPITDDFLAQLLNNG